LAALNEENQKHEVGFGLVEVVAVERRRHRGNASLGDISILAQNSAAARAHVGVSHTEPGTRRNPAPAKIGGVGKEKRKNRAGKERGNRWQSFDVPPDNTDTGGMAEERHQA
jgi:hypothetical protein